MLTNDLDWEGGRVFNGTLPVADGVCASVIIFYTALFINLQRPDKQIGH